MLVIQARNVNEVWPVALQLVERDGVPTDSRNGRVLVHPMPVTTVYDLPRERVLLDPVRDANPIFHLHEALWMLTGRDDATWLDRYVSDFSARFAESGGVMHGAYGKRWRDWFDDAAYRADYQGIRERNIDQLDEVVRILRADPTDRQCVIQMWDAEADLGVQGLKDRPCNTQIYLRADRRADWSTETGSTPRGGRSVLDMTVTCRSNDIVYGCYGANVVHFSILQEYLAARMGYEVGRYTQVSNNWHLYDWARDRTSLPQALLSAGRPYPGWRPLVDDPNTFDVECRMYVDQIDQFTSETPFDGWGNAVFGGVAHPMEMANRARKAHDFNLAMWWADKIAAPDWRAATMEWIERRKASHESVHRG
jgi:thymidylate synthase